MEIYFIHPSVKLLWVDVMFICKKKIYCFYFRCALHCSLPNSWINVSFDRIMWTKKRFLRKQKLYEKRIRKRLKCSLCWCWLSWERNSFEKSPFQGVLWAPNMASNLRSHSDGVVAAASLEECPMIRCVSVCEWTSGGEKSDFCRVCLFYGYPVSRWFYFD